MTDLAATAPRMPSTRWSNGAIALAAIAASTVLLLVLAGPIALLLVAHAGSGARALVTDTVVQGAIVRTLATATVSTALAVALGVPLAWWLASRRGPAMRVLAALLDLPLVLPHPVAGIALLLAFGTQSAVGRGLVRVGLEVVSMPAGIVLAMLFVSAPLVISTARDAFAAIPPDYVLVARSLGHSPWSAVRRVALPMAMPTILAGTATAWARAVSEFGAIVILAYNPKVASVLAYERFTSYGLEAALPVAAALVLVTLLPLAMVRVFSRRELLLAR
ncbi:MAG: ABC transporter permease [Gemmatimonadaceae bacterium]|nr:ABC transporter permease [Gemmatimonadaceae bacterium]